jgi:hypothetical protein
MSATVRKYASYSSVAMTASSSSICCRYASGRPCGNRWGTPSSTSFLSHDAGVSPAGTISCGYSYFSSPSEKLQRPAKTIVFSSHSCW